MFGSNNRPRNQPVANELRMEGIVFESLSHSVHVSEDPTPEIDKCVSETHREIYEEEKTYLLWKVNLMQSSLLFICLVIMDISGNLFEKGKILALEIVLFLMVVVAIVIKVTKQFKLIRFLNFFYQCFWIGMYFAETNVVAQEQINKRIV